MSIVELIKTHSKKDEPVIEFINQWRNVSLKSKIGSSFCNRDVYPSDSLGASQYFTRHHAQQTSINIVQQT